MANGPTNYCEAKALPYISFESHAAIIASCANGSLGEGQERLASAQQIIVMRNFLRKRKSKC